MNVKVRFPPSPTGFCHVGTARMAILNYLFARKHGGIVIFRSEDTDKERSRPEFETDIIESLSWLGLSWDAFYRQSERTTLYTTVLEKLIAEGKAYVSDEESKKDPGVRVSPVRLKNPGSVVTFTDLIRGEISFDTTELKDCVIARSITDPLYHLAVVLDDSDMGITHIIRGEDHISNTPRQILIQEALGIPRPLYAHYPLHLSADRAKLSKRTGDVSVRSYREKGFLSGALLNYLAVLGWTPPSGKEILSLNEMISEFEIANIHKSGAVFDIDKLRWFNREYLLMLSSDEFDHEALMILKKAAEERKLPWNHEVAKRLALLIKERIHVWDDVRTQVRDGEFDFFFADPSPDVGLIPQKGVSTEETLRHLVKTSEIIGSMPDAAFTAEDTVKDQVFAYATIQGRAAVLWPLRYSLTGLLRSPDPFAVMHAIGKDATLRRLETARSLLSV